MKAHGGHSGLPVTYHRLKSLHAELMLSQHSGITKLVIFGVSYSPLGEKVVACVSIRDDWRWVDPTTEHKGEGSAVYAHIHQVHCRLSFLSKLTILITIFWSRMPYCFKSFTRVSPRARGGWGRELPHLTSMSSRTLSRPFQMTASSLQLLSTAKREVTVPQKTTVLRLFQRCQQQRRRKAEGEAEPTS